jgi:hypothetical protein
MPCIARQKASSLSLLAPDDFLGIEQQEQGPDLQLAARHL